MLTDAQLTTLKAFVDGDAGYNTLENGPLMEKLNDPSVGSFTRYALLPGKDLLRWTIKRNVLGGIKSASEDVAHACRSICIGLMTWFTVESRGIDLNEAEIMGMVDVLVAAGVLSADDKTDLLASVSYAVSKIEDMFGEGVQIGLKEIRRMRVL